jgi:hypothetical protein
MLHVRLAMLAALTIVSAVSLAANGQTAHPDGAQSPGSRPDVTISASPSDVRSTSFSGILKVENVRIETPPSVIMSEAALLKFELLNAASTPLTAITVEISVREKGEADLPGVQLVRPFAIRGDTVLKPGYTLNFQMLLRNLSPGCACTAQVEVVSARALTR